MPERDRSLLASPDPNSYEWWKTRVLSPEASRLLKLQEQVRWGIVVLCWLAIGLPCLWALRIEIWRLLEFFTWAGVRYGIVYRPLPGFGLVLCVSVSLSTLLWQSYREVFGLSGRERRELERLATMVRKQGPTHFLWRWVVGSDRVRQ